ncbi:MAG TPA: 3-ketoacyl-ACP reductase [Pseudorhodoferax sp.]|jgi:NAD(P)-dependent dehydrogenase (short-subunit alcohol dehydrogenase family)|nr:3-ketoacyl-ACP reductase [Pseudorhodoferax sp.]
MDTPHQSRRAAIVTGARRGIGRAIAYCLADAGFDLCLNDLVGDDAMAETGAEVRRRGARLATVLGDIAETSTHADIVGSAWEAFGRVDCLVNNAGVQVRRREDLMRVQPDDFDRLLRVNLRGTFFLTQAVAARMLQESGEREGRCIVTLSSANAAMASVEKGGYCIAKSGLSMMNKLFAARLAAHGICCHEIQPGLIETDMTAPVHGMYGERIRQGLTPIPRWGQPLDIGRAVAALATQAMPFTTGHAFQIDGGLQLSRL